MSEEKKVEGQSLTRRKRRISLAWLIPVLAAVVTAALLYKNTLERGPEIEITIASAAGIEAGKTLVKMRSVTVGRVETVRLDRNFSKAVLTVRMEPGTEPLLSEDSRFWLVKPRVESAGISGLDTLLSGSYLQISKGSSEKRATSFEALDEPPALLSDAHGLTLNFYSTSRKRLSPGDPVVYRGFSVGSVLSAKLNVEDGTVLYSVFIADPYVKLLNATTRFWITSGIDFSLTTEGLEVSAESVDSILRGGMAFDNLEGEFADRPLKTDTEIELFGSYAEAAADAVRSGLLYVVLIDGDLYNIRQGAGIYFNSVKVGEVIEAPWFGSYRELFENTSALPVLIGLNIQDESRAVVEKIIADRAASGTLCASLASANIISGNNRINLSFAEKSGQCPVTSYRGHFAFMATAPVSIDDRLNAISESLAQIDLSGISSDLRSSLQAFTGAMEAFTRSNDEIERLQLLPRMTTAFTNFTTMLTSYDKHSEFYGKMEGTLNEIRSVLNDLKPALMQLGQKPQSLIFGAEPNEVIPKAQGE
ncbi:MAG TPA: MCE family protein [Candidatus Avisuccinivibrio pullicola]|nr:MCE family protein [Candidatus Avisuccinivibrio pullicola]